MTRKHLSKMIKAAATMMTRMTTNPQELEHKALYGASLRIVRSLKMLRYARVAWTVFSTILPDSKTVAITMLGLSRRAKLMHYYKRFMKFLMSKNTIIDLTLLVSRADRLVITLETVKTV